MDTGLKNRVVQLPVVLIVILMVILIFLLYSIRCHGHALQLVLVLETVQTV